MNYKYKEYYDRFKDLRQKIKNKEATWKDMEMLRLEYIDDLSIGKDYPVKYYTGNTLRQGCLLYDEFMENGVIKEVSEDGEITRNKELYSINEAVNFPKSVEMKTDGSYTSERIVSEDLTLKSKEAILKKHGYNPNEFELISCKHSIWQQGSKRNGTNTLYSSKISVKSKIIPTNPEYYYNLIDKIFKEKGIQNSSINIDDFENKIVNFNNNNLKNLVLNYTDIHWGRYTSYQSDVDDEYKRILSTMDNAIDKFKGKGISIITLVLGSDFFNSDCYGKTTLHKHSQNNNMNFKDIFETGMKLCVELINKAIDICNDIQVIIIPGNHGNNEDYMLGKCLEAYYHEENKIWVKTFKNRGYTKWGNTLIGFTHGDKEKGNLSNLMAIESPKEWAETKHHIWLTGHIHSVKETVNESNGVTIYNCPSLALDDEYTSDHGYKSAKRIMGFIISRNKGVEEIHYFYPN